MSNSNKAFDFRSNPDPEFFLAEYLPLRNRDSCKNFAGSAALAEVCTVHMVLILLRTLWQTWPTSIH